MRSLRYALLNPTGNRTCLVLDPISDAARPGITAALMDRCEQVGYLMPASKPSAMARLQMMGGEFCGNASMATAAFLLRDRLTPGQEETVYLEVSGADAPVRCAIRREEKGWRGTVTMPPVEEIRRTRVGAVPLTAVTLPGMVHLIDVGASRGRDEAEALLTRAAAEIQAPALGLLRWEETSGRMTPLVFVRESQTLVWETACGSGSTAIAAWMAWKAGKSAEVEIEQPGGVLAVRAEWRDGGVRELRLTGHVTLEAEETLELNEIE